MSDRALSLEEYSKIERELLHAAVMALLTATEDGRLKYPPYHWRQPEETIQHQIDRAKEHAEWANVIPVDSQDDDLAHAIARLVIAYARRTEGLP